MKKWRKNMTRYHYVQRLLVDLDRTLDREEEASDLRVFTEQMARQEFGPKWRDVLNELSRVVFVHDDGTSTPIVKDWIVESGVVAVICLPRRCIVAIAGRDGFDSLRLTDRVPVEHGPAMARLGDRGWLGAA